MKICGADLGPERSAYAVLCDGKIVAFDWIDNAAFLEFFRNAPFAGPVIVESPQAQDKPLGKMLRDTIVLAGRLFEVLDSCGYEWHEAEERDVALWLTGNRSAGNPAILQSLKDVFGDRTQQPCAECDNTGRVKGCYVSKKCPACKGRGFLHVDGPLACMNEHCRSALAAAWWWSQKSKFSPARAG